MNVHVWLYWLPVLVAVGIAGRLVGRPRGWIAGLVGGAYWVILVVTVVGNGFPVVFGDFASLALGALTIVLCPGLVLRQPGAGPQPASDEQPALRTESGEEIYPFHRFADVYSLFDDWLASYRHKPDPWPDFGEHIRTALCVACDAKQVGAYRLLDDSEVLFPLRRMDTDDTGLPSARAGVVGHVVTSGMSYYHGDPTQGELVELLAKESESSMDWCFAIKQDRRTIGVITVGSLEPSLRSNRAWMKMLEHIITLCWVAFTETCRGRLASFTDPVSGVLTQNAFMEAANHALRSSYDKSEPVALISVSIEGLRGMADHGQWDLANEMLYEISAVLKQRVREDDEIGVLDGSRFLVLLRRVDSELAMLISKQLMDKLVEICGDTQRWGAQKQARCGVAGSGLGTPPLRDLVERATEACRVARLQGKQVLSDLDAREEVVAV